jgi:hypothetical protein
MLFRDKYYTYLGIPQIDTINIQNIIDYIEKNYRYFSSNHSYLKIIVVQNSILYNNRFYPYNKIKKILSNRYIGDDDDIIAKICKIKKYKCNDILLKDHIICMYRIYIDLVENKQSSNTCYISMNHVIDK